MSLVIRELVKALLSHSNTQMVIFFIRLQKFVETGSQVPKLVRGYGHLQIPFTISSPTVLQILGSRCNEGRKGK